MDSRHLIYLTTKPDPKLQRQFEEADWRVTVVSTSKDAREIEDVEQAAGGLVDLATGFAARDLVQIERCLAISHIGWIAIVAPGQLDEPLARRFVRDYCFDYVTMPVDPAKLMRAVGHACGMVQLIDPSAAVQVEVTSEGEMIGACAAMLTLFRTIRKMAATDAPVFIGGESGTGKELTAAAIHRRSGRRNAPFVPINCGAIPRELIQSELFGYERGAFTGANQRRIGRVEAANGGTLFLDEIGDLPLESQASLLRFLQERKVDRLGGRESIDVDARIISATHVDLRTAVSEGRFREDLYHRLCVLHLEVPPLRDREGDIELLAHHMIGQFRKDAGRRLHGFSMEALQAIGRHTWPGNVRELGNRVQRAIVMAEGRQITAADLELDHLVDQRAMSLERARDTAERHAIEQALLRHRGRLVDVARELGISRVTLYRLLVSHGLRDAAAPSDAGASGTAST